MIIQVTCPDCGGTVFIEVSVVTQPAPVVAPRQSSRPPYTGSEDSCVEIRRYLVAHYKLDELKTLCSDFSINYQQIPYHDDGPLENFALEIITYFKNRRRLPKLVQALRRGR
jgi:hypothetical protein